MIPRPYRELLDDHALRGLLGGIGVSALGDGISAVTVAWLAVRLAPRGELGLFVGIALAAYSMPGAVGAIALGRVVRWWPARWLVLGDCMLRASMLGAIAAMSLAGALSPGVYVALLGGSSVMAAWGTSGEYTLLSALGGPTRRLTANAVASAQASIALIVGPALAGLLLARLAAGWLIALDAASFAFLGIQALRTPVQQTMTERPTTSERRGAGFAVLRREHLYGLIVVTCVFFFLYGPVEDALPVFVAHDLRDHAGLLGAYWSAFGVGALAATLITGLTNPHHSQFTIVLVMAGWGACLLPFAFSPVGVTLVCFAIGGLIYGPFVPLTYALFQSLATPGELPAILAARSALITIAGPLGMAAGGPLIVWLGAPFTITASGAATIALACATSLIWRKRVSSASQAEAG